jgi:predicted aspartyl protease
MVHRDRWLGWRQIQVFLLLAGLSACKTSNQPTDVSADKFFGNDHRPCTMEKIGEMPLREENRHFYIAGTIHGQPITLLFDTGAWETILSLATVRRLNLTAEPGRTGEIVGIGGKTAVSVYRVKFILNGARDWERYVLAGDYGLKGSHALEDGLIGPSFFGGFDIDLDVPGHRINLYFPEHNCSSPSAYMHGPLFQVPIAHPEIPAAITASPGKQRIAAFISTLIDASPRVLVSVGGKELVAGIDSGAPDNILFVSGAQKIGITPQEIAASKPTLAFGTGPDAMPAVNYTISSADVGPLEIMQLPVTIVDQNLPSGLDMILGTDFLHRVHVWISGSSDSLIMQYPPTPSP